MIQFVENWGQSNEHVFTFVTFKFGAEYWYYFGAISILKVKITKVVSWEIFLLFESSSKLDFDLKFL